MRLYRRNEMLIRGLALSKIASGLARLSFE
jgi:hypothetical protein